MAGRDESAPIVVRSCFVDRPPSQLPNDDRASGGQHRGPYDDPRTWEGRRRTLGARPIPLAPFGENPGTGASHDTPLSIYRSFRISQSGCREDRRAARG
jgi:hypothetical protein